MEELKIVLGNKIMHILFFVDRSPSMNTAVKKNKSPIQYLNQCLSVILQSIVKQSNLRSCVEVGYLMVVDEEYHKIEFGDVAFLDVPETDRNVYRISESTHEDTEQNRKFIIRYRYPKFQAQKNKNYSGTDLYKAIEVSVNTLIDRLNSSGKKLTHPSFLVILSDGDHSFEDKSGEETIRRLKECCLGNGPVNRMIVPLFVDVSIKGESKYLKHLADAVFPEGYIRYSPDISSNTFSATFQRVLLSAQKSANKQGDRAHMLSRIGQKLKE